MASTRTVIRTWDIAAAEAPNNKNYSLGLLPDNARLLAFRTVYESDPISGATVSDDVLITLFAGNGTEVIGTFPLPGEKGHYAENVHTNKTNVWSGAAFNEAKEPVVERYWTVARSPTIANTKDLRIFVTDTIGVAAFVTVEVILKLNSLTEIEALQAQVAIPGY